jgi:L-ribulose-5-phosphate 3-epimerase
MKIGMTQCAMWGKPLDEFLPAAAKAGFDCVELMVGTSPELPLDATPHQIKAVQDKVKAHNLTLNSLALFCSDGNLLDPLPARQAAIEGFKKGLHTAKALGVKMVLMTSGRLRPDLFYEDGYNNGIAAFKELAKTAEALDIDIAVEFVWNGFLFSPIEFRNFLDAIGSPKIGFYFDPGNMIVFQQPTHWVRALKNHIKGVHFKDWTGGPLDGKWTGLLEGKVDYPGVMKELKSSSFQGAFISEVDPALQDLSQTVQAARKVALMV